MSTSYTRSTRNPLFLWRPLVVASAILALSTLSGCASTNASSDDFATQSTEVTETPESDITTETEQPQAEYKKPENRPDYKEVIEKWYAQDEKTIEKIGKSDADEDLEKRAQFIAALYLEASNEDEYPVYGNNGFSLSGITADANYANNPLFGIDPQTANDKQLDAMLAAQEMFPVVRALWEFHNGKPEKMEDINFKTFDSLLGHTKLHPNSRTLGFGRAHSDAFFQKLNEEPTRPKTRTERISDEDVAAIGILKNAYKPPVSEKYPTFWVKSSRVDNPDVFLIRAVTVVPLSDAAGQIPDFDGNYYAYEYEDPGTPVSKGHPEAEVKIPVIRVEYIVKQENLPDNLK